MTQSIPVVNLRHFTHGTAAERCKFIDTMGDALRDLGFFALENHGVDSSVIEHSYAEATKFFELSEATKKKYEDLALKGQRGFTSFGREHAKDSKAPDLKEFFHVGRDLPLTHPLYSTYPKNIWPTEQPVLKETFSKLFTQLDACSMALLDACSIYIGEEEVFLANQATDGNTILRVIHYPEISTDRDPASIRAAAHEDINFITLLCEATAGGLELLRRDGSWLPIQSLKGQIIVDTGDMLQNLTNGILKSTTHRVVNPDNSRERRFSMPFFVHPRSEVDLSPLPKCISKVGERKYPSITAGEYLDKRLREIGLAAGKK